MFKFKPRCRFFKTRVWSDGVTRHERYLKTNVKFPLKYSERKAEGVKVRLKQFGLESLEEKKLQNLLKILIKKKVKFNIKRLFFVCFCHEFGSHDLEGIPNALYSLKIVI